MQRMEWGPHPAGSFCAACKQKYGPTWIGEDGSCHNCGQSHNVITTQPYVARAFVLQYHRYDVELQRCVCKEDHSTIYMTKDSAERALAQMRPDKTLLGGWTWADQLAEVRVLVAGQTAHILPRASAIVL